MLATQCVEWCVVLAILLLDSSLVAKTVQEVKGHSDVDTATLVRTVQGYEELCDWADNEWCVLVLLCVWGLLNYC